MQRSSPDHHQQRRTRHAPAGGTQVAAAPLGGGGVPHVQVAQAVWAGRRGRRRACRSISSWSGLARESLERWRHTKRWVSLLRRANADDVPRRPLGACARAGRSTAPPRAGGKGLGVNCGKVAAARRCLAKTGGKERQYLPAVQRPPGRATHPYCFAPPPGAPRASLRLLSLRRCMASGLLCVVQPRVGDVAAGEGD